MCLGGGGNLHEMQVALRNHSKEMIICKSGHQYLSSLRKLRHHSRELTAKNQGKLSQKDADLKKSERSTFLGSPL